MRWVRFAGKQSLKFRICRNENLITKVDLLVIFIGLFLKLPFVK